MHTERKTVKPRETLIKQTTNTKARNLVCSHGNHLLTGAPKPMSECYVIEHFVGTVAQRSVRCML